MDRVCEMCTSLTELQILKILNLYTPLDDYEPRVPISFIRKVQIKLQETKSSQAQQVRIISIDYLVVFLGHNKSKLSCQLEIMI